jgi:hypothetical protein
MPVFACPWTSIMRILGTKRPALLFVLQNGKHECTLSKQHLNTEEIKNKSNGKQIVVIDRCAITQTAQIAMGKIMH